MTETTCQYVGCERSAQLPALQLVYGHPGAPPILSVRLCESHRAEYDESPHRDTWLAEHIPGFGS